MALTYTQIVGEIGAILDLDVTSGSEGETSVKRFVNWGGRRVWHAKPWFERRAELVISTVAPYTTGTADFTNASTSVAGTGTTWVTGMTGRKIGRSYGSPWYRFTYGSGTTGTLAQAFAETTATGSEYVIYQDEYDIASTCDVIVNASTLNTDHYGRLTKIGESVADSLAYVHGHTGKPRYYSMTHPTTATTRRIRIYPIPDAVYRLRVRYLKAWTDLSGTTDTHLLGDAKEILLVKAALLEAQKLSDVRKVTSEGEVESLIERAWRDQQDAGPTSYHRYRLDEDGTEPWLMAEVDY